MIMALSLRQRFALFFCALYVTGLAAIVGGLWFGYSRAGGAPDGYVIGAVVGGFGLLGATAWVAFLFDENVAKPILGLAAELTTRAQTGVELDIDVQQSRYLGTLAPSANAINEALIMLRTNQALAIEAETKLINRDKALFEALLRDLSEGVVVVSPDQRVMLFNRVAQGLLGGLGLDRDLSECLQVDPLQLALSRLTARTPSNPTAVETFLASSLDGVQLLQGRVGAVTSDGQQIGYVLIFRDATEDLATHREHDHLFNTLLEHTRRPVAAISAALDVLQSDADMPGEMRGRFTANIQEEVDHLITRLQTVSARHDAMLGRYWPMSDVSSREIFLGLMARDDSDLTETGDEHFIVCDVFAVLQILSLALDGLRESGARSSFAFAATAEGATVTLALSWTGEALGDDALNAWMKKPLSRVYGQYSGQDALATHRTDIWSERCGDGHRIVLPLRSASAPKLQTDYEHSEFFDFDLQRNRGDLGLEDRPLSELSFVVFDTETTGLSPRSGDEIIQIAGVRIVNGRILKREVFDTLVDPKRPIPAASTKIHGITDAMVDGAPGVVKAGQAFHDFCKGSVLVAHNAPFDMTFLQLQEDAIGRRFDQPVLCTVLLSAVLFKHTNKHTLDALAERLDVTIPESVRHTAIGDAMATAEAFLHMLELLKHAEVATLGQAIDASQSATRIKKKQAY